MFEGEFLTGAIHLQSNVELHLARGATLKFRPNPKAYLPVVFTRFEEWNATTIRRCLRPGAD